MTQIFIWNYKSNENYRKTKHTCLEIMSIYS
eukprot:UN18484